MRWINSFLFGFYLSGGLDAMGLSLGTRIWFIAAGIFLALFIIEGVKNA